MLIAAQVFNRVIGVRLIVVIFVIMMAAGLQPRSISDLATAINTFLLRITVDLVAYPPLKSSITLVHVPDVEYEAWLADIAGAESFMQLLQKINASNNPLVASKSDTVITGSDSQGTLTSKHQTNSSHPPLDKPIAALIAEQPLMLIQGRAEKLVYAWAKKKPVRPSLLAAELTAATVARESLVSTAKHNLLIGGPAIFSGENKKITLKPYQFTSHSTLNTLLSQHIWPLTRELYIEADSSPLQQFLLPPQTLKAVRFGCG